MDHFQLLLHCYYIDNGPNIPNYSTMDSLFSIITRIIMGNNGLLIPLIELPNLELRSLLGYLVTNLKFKFWKTKCLFSKIKTFWILLLLGRSRKSTEYAFIQFNKAL